MVARWQVRCLIGLGLAGLACGGHEITNCDDEPDVTGAWALHFTPTVVDGGTPIPGEVDVDAQLEQAGKTDFLGLGHFVYGTLATSDPSYFGTLTIPRLLKNDGSKTGAILGCTLRINIPVATPVTDDDADQGRLRLQLVGQVTTKGVLTGVPGSRLILSDDQAGTPRDFDWTGARR